MADGGDGRSGTDEATMTAGGRGGGSCAADDGGRWRRKIRCFNSKRRALAAWIRLSTGTG
ncbi:hypothetical protein OsI_32888 [Oryza sativa Indica Group]|uniref:Uncharacterized protein n=1 Tax=Oryza sativa subsp. indica TaxID=39946 RepID=B8BFY5_ORYSI|nr:hypothetical protein OsI_32888 [Oryza sativa Indica Group]